MDELAVVSPSRPARRRRWFWRIGLVLTLAIGVVVAAIVYFWYRSDQELREALAEADRRDPGWRFADLEAARSEIPEEENAALQVLAAAQLLPRPWFAPPPVVSARLEAELEKMMPGTRLDARQAAHLRAELAKAAGALAAARSLADMPRGRYPVNWSSDLIGTPMPHIDAVRQVSRLLTLDALLRAHDQDVEGALMSLRAMLNAGRSVGDEPTAISQHVRVFWCQDRVISALEHALALGRPSETALAALQRLLEEESRQPLLLIAARGDRAGVHQFLDSVRTGRCDRAAYKIKPSLIGSRGDDLVDRAKATTIHAAYLRFLTEVVEAAKLPSEQRLDRVRQLKAPEGNVPILLEALNGSPGYHRNWFFLFRRGEALLRCAVVALAVERYRLRHQRWPDRLDALVPELLGEVPPDPFDGRPLRYRQLPDGIVVYSVGQDRQDQGGNLDRAQSAGTDLGFQLWNADRRAQPPNPPK